MSSPRQPPSHPLARRAARLVVLLLAGLLYAVAIKYFVLPAKVILTGTEGIATALSYYFESYTLFIILYLVFQLALLALGFVLVGRAFAVRSLLVVVTVFIALALLPELEFADPEPTNERILLVLFGGILAGLAKALAFKQRGSTGDEDIVAAYFAAKYLRPVGSIAVVAAVGSTAFGIALDLIKHGDLEPAVNTLMYTAIYIFVSAETLNNFYRKFRISLLAVVTRHAKTVGDAISDTLPHRTFTLDRGVGGRSGETFTIVRTVLTHEELADAVRAVQAADPDSFYYHHDIEGISGRYYITPVA